MTEEQPSRRLGRDEPKTWYGKWLPRAAVAVVVILAVGFGSMWVFENTADFLLTILVSFFVAAAMLPAVDKLSRRGWRRGVATAFVMFVGGLIALVFGLAILSVFVDQLIQLVATIPDYVDEVAVWLSESFNVEIDIEEFSREVLSFENLLSRYGSSVVGGVLGFTSSVVGLVFRLLTIALFVFYMLADFPKMRGAILQRFKPDQQQEIQLVMVTAIDKVGGYVYSRSLLAALSAGFHFVVFWLIDLPYPLALALWVGVVSQFIPTVGTYMAGAVPIVVALLEDPILAIWVLIAILVYQQIENYFFSPRITANTMDLHPAVAFGSVIIGGSLLGGVGALLALPAAATVIALVSSYTHRYELIESDQFESPEQYEARMQAKADEKAVKAKSRFQRIRNALPSNGESKAPEEST